MFEGRWWNDFHQLFFYPSSGSVAPFGEGKWFDRPKADQDVWWEKALIGVDPVDLFFVARGVQFTDVIWWLALLQLKNMTVVFLPLNLLSNFENPHSSMKQDLHKTTTWQKRKIPSLKLPFWRACAACVKFRWEQYLRIPSFQQTWQWNLQWCPLLTGL